MNQRIACLWFPNWPIQRRVVSQPELRKQQVILIERDARRGQLVAAASPLAMRAGVSVAMPLVEAKSLLQNGQQKIPRSSPQEEQQKVPKSSLQDGQQKIQKQGERRKIPKSSLQSGQQKNPESSLQNRQQKIPKSSLQEGRQKIPKSRSDGMMEPRVSTRGKGVPHETSRGATAGDIRKPLNDFHLLPHQPDEDRAALEALADSLESCSPIVGLESFDEPHSNKRRKLAASKHSPESIFMDVTGLAHLFGDEQRLAELATEQCQQAGYLVRIAIANTLGEAWAIARYSRQQFPVVLEQESSEKQHATCYATQELPVESLRLPAEIIETLHQLGIQTVGQLERLPRAELAMRFGHAIGLRLDQLNGQIDEPVIARRLPPEFQRHQSLDFPTRHRETIETIATRLVQELCQQLREKQRGALQWRFVLDQVEGESIEFTIRLFQATSTPTDVLPLLAMHLEQALQPHTRRFRKKNFLNRRPSAPNSKNRTSKTENRKPQSSVQMIRTMSIDIQDVTVEVVSSALLAQHQRRLFDENPHADQQAITSLINRLTSRIGASNVVCAKLQANAQPEYSFRLQPLVDVRQRRVTRSRKHSHLFARPLRLFHPPRELRVAIDRERAPNNHHTFPGTNISRPPALLAYEPSGAEESRVHPSPEKVTRVWGPERIETGWWRGRTTCRDYWRVETENGNHLWLFRDLRRRKWFVQGEF